MKNLLNYLLPAYSRWYDVGLFASSGNYKLVQVSYNLKSNKKRFRTTSMGFVNDHTAREQLYRNTLMVGVKDAEYIKEERAKIDSLIGN